MSSALTSEASAAEGLHERLASLGDAPLSLDERTLLLERFFALPSRREKPGRFWRVDFDSIVPDAGAIDANATISNARSEDPAVLYGPHTAEGPRDHTRGTGAIRAFGEHKGSGLAFICELLGGALTGTGATSGGRQFANGMLAFYVDPKVVDTSNFFDGEISRYVDFIRATKPIAGVDTVLIPGDTERKTRAERTKNGIPLPDDTWAAIVSTAREVGVSEASIQRAAS